MSCEYCNASSEDLKLCQLHAHPRDKQWQFPRWLCKSCREYFRGIFRYSPISQDEHRSKYLGG